MYAPAKCVYGGSLRYIAMTHTTAKTGTTVAPTMSQNASMCEPTYRYAEHTGPSTRATLPLVLSQPTADGGAGTSDESSSALQKKLEERGTIRGRKGGDERTQRRGGSKRTKEEEGREGRTLPYTWITMLTLPV